MYSPFSFMTAGLNVPADSKPSPRGEMTGFPITRAHVPTGGLYLWAGCAAKAAQTTRSQMQPGAIFLIVRVVKTVRMSVCLAYRSNPSRILLRSEVTPRVRRGCGWWNEVCLCNRYEPG